MKSLSFHGSSLFIFFGMRFAIIWPYFNYKPYYG